MLIWKLIRKKFLGAKYPIASVKAILDEIDTDNDGCVSVGEVIDGIKGLMVDG